MSVNGSCHYCPLDQADYDIDCDGCRARFRYDHLHKFIAAKKLEYEFRYDTSILQVREEQDE